MTPFRASYKANVAFSAGMNPERWAWRFLQGVRQIYVLVLGLDVLGNPYGLISGIGEGFKDLFYEPYQVTRTPPLFHCPVTSTLSRRSLHKTTNLRQF